MNKNRFAVTKIGIVVSAFIIFALVVIKVTPAFRGRITSSQTVYRSPACDISYVLPPGWVSQGWAADNEIVTLSSPDDIRKDEINTRTTDAGSASPSISFYASCADDVIGIFEGQNRALFENGATVEAALAKGTLRDLKNARYVSTIEVAGQKAFVYEVGTADSGSGMRYDSVFVYVKDHWMEIRPNMVRFADMSQDQRKILDSIRILDTK